MKRFLPEFNWEQKSGKRRITKARQKAKVENRKERHLIFSTSRLITNRKL